MFIGTHLPSSAIPDLKLSDKFYHVTAFAGLAFFLAWALPKRPGGMMRNFASVFGLTLSYAMMDEWTQQFIPGRSSDRWDVAADSVGIPLGFAVYLLLRAVCIRVEFLHKLILAVSR